ncbi:MAG: phosphoribosyl-ATP diphosphatase [Sphingopyxis sp.]
MANPFQQLESIVDDRLAGGDVAQSYVAKLASRGTAKVAQKLGEEAVETVIAALSEGDEALIGEAADLTFHLTLLLRMRGLCWADIHAELDRRHGVSGIAEKASRPAQ